MWPLCYQHSPPHREKSSTSSVVSVHWALMESCTIKVDIIIIILWILSLEHVLWLLHCSTWHSMNPLHSVCSFLPHSQQSVHLYSWSSSNSWCSDPTLIQPETVMEPTCTPRHHTFYCIPTDTIVQLIMCNSAICVCVCVPLWFVYGHFFWCLASFCWCWCSWQSVSYTHLTLPTMAVV